MENGYVECTMTTCAVTGAAGSGKSHTMSLVFNEDPPAIRESTGLCEPVRAVSTVVGSSESDSSEWTIVDEDKVLNIVAGATTVTNTKEQLNTSESSLESSDSSLESSDSESSLESSDSSLESSDSEKSSNTELEKQGSHTEVEDELLEKLAGFLEESRGQGRVAKLDFLYFLDSGGQPQFHELLPSFIPNLSAILFVLKLSEELSHNPEIEFYVKGKLVHSYPFPYSHEQILKHCIRALQPEKRSSSSSSPSIAVVGTHRDLELSCAGETREEKNQKLLDLLQPRFGNSLIFYENLKKLIFPVNAKEPSEEDRAVADILRKAIIHFSAPKPVKIPLPWFILEQVLRKLAKEKGTGVMHIDECRKVAKRLHIERDAFDAALKYLVNLNIFLYYPTVLPKVLFCEPQVALDKINELVECYHTLCGGSNTIPGNVASTCMRGLSGKKWLRFQSFGVFQEKLLHDEAFSGHYDRELFTPSDLLKLLEALHVVGKVNTRDVIPEYVMPSLLFELKPDDLGKHRCNPATSPAAPLLVYFPDEWPASGIFCSFLTSLLSTYNWEVMIDSRNKPICLYRNCLEFEHPEMLGKITLIDSFDQGYFEVHVHAPLEQCKKFCLEIRQALFAALPHKAPEAELAFFCPKSRSMCCSSSLHLARISPKHNYNCWKCSEKPGDVYGYVSESPNMMVWAQNGDLNDTGFQGIVKDVQKARSLAYPEFLLRTDPITVANLTAQQHSGNDDRTKSLSLMDITACSRYIDGDLTLLAAALDIPDEDMSIIRSKYKNVQGQALQMLKKWQSSGTRTRHELIKLLQSTGFSQAAVHILATSPENTLIQQGPKEPGVWGVVTREQPKGGCQSPIAGVPTATEQQDVGEKDLHDILSATIEVAARWKHIGDTFRLSPGTLETIRVNYSDAEDCLREVILRWLRKSGYDDRLYGPPTWKWVVEAVGSPAGGNNPELARRIAAHHSRGSAVLMSTWHKYWQSGLGN